MKVDQEKIHRFSMSWNLAGRLKAVRILRNEFKILPDKSGAWSDLIRLTNDKDPDVRWRAAESLRSVFVYVPDKSGAWSDLVRLTNDKDSYVRWRAAESLGSVFSSVPHEYKSAAWADLHRLTSNKDSTVREDATYSLGSAFKYFPDKSAAWADLHKLATDEDSDVRAKAAEALGSAFKYFPDKSAAWADLHKLATDEDSDVREDATYSLYSAFEYIPDKSAAWADLHRLATDEDSDVRAKAAEALGSTFKYFPDKSAAWADLIRLKSDDNSRVKMYANHSLGKICIYKASKSENVSDSRALLEDAIRYFEKAANERTEFNPAKFCNLFYRSFDAVIFKKTYSKKEIDGYIAAAKTEIGNSKSKQQLIEAVEQLAEVLETAQNAREGGIDHQELLKRCSNICNHVDQLMIENKDKAPAIHELYRKVKPSFDERIKELIDEVKEKAEAACREAKGTVAQPIACSINKEIQGWHVENQEQMAKKIENLTSSLKLQIPNLPANAFIHSKIDEIKSCHVVEDQFEMLTTIVSLLPTISIQKDISDIKKDTTEIRKTSRQVSTRVQKIHNILNTPGGKIGTALTVGGFFTTAFLLLFSSDPNIGYMAFIFGSLIAIAFYLFS